MNLCNKNHDEVCYEGWTCPLCETIAEYENTVEKLQGQIESLNVDVQSLTDDLNGRKEALVEVLEAAQEVKRRKETHEHSR